MGDHYGDDSHKRRWELNTKLLSDVLGAERSQLYSLYHAMGIYENQRATSSDKRVVNLTRSSYAGQQRYSTITWNGDTYASWNSFARMIPAGLNFMATGCPYWTVDIGAFFTKKVVNGSGRGIIIKEWLIWDIVSCIPVCFNMAHSCLYFVAMVPILPVRCGVLANPVSPFTTV